MRSRCKIILFALLLIVCCSAIGVKESKAAGPYLIKINKQQCVVTIYKQDKKGAYTVPVKAMICSPGNATPIGTFSLKEKIRWHTLDGPCYGQYCSRIVGGVLFHSVWYYQPNPSTLACAQYNNLGSRVSHGCVRLCVRDAKWIYENCSSGTTVVIYNSSNPGPLGKPVSIKVPGYMGWDPTDTTNPNNPWNKKKPTIIGAKNKTIVFASKYKINQGLKVKNTTGFNAIKLLKTNIQYKDGASKKYKKVKSVNTKKPGLYKITYKITDEIGRKAQVTVKHKVLTKVNVNKITLSVSSKTLYLGGTAKQKTFTLKVKKVTPAKASIKTVAAKSSNNKIATISKKGKVIAKKAGQCKITFTAADGSGTKAICQITVKQKAKSLNVKASSNKIYVGNTLKLQTSYLPANTSDKRTSFTSSNSSVATVDANGVVKGLSSGTVTITAKAKDGSGCTAKISLTVFYQYSAVVNGPKQSMTLPFGTDFAAEMAKLPNTLTIKDAVGNMAQAGVVWDTSEYTSGAANCNVFGMITLPKGWEGMVPKYQIEVTLQKAPD